MRKKSVIISLLLLFWALFPENQPLFPQKVFTQVDTACQCLDKGEIDKAIELLKKELKISSNNLNARLYLGIAYYQKKDLENAFKEFEKIEKIIMKRVDFDRPETPAWSRDGWNPEQVDTNLIESWMDRQTNVIFSKEKLGLLYFCRGLTLKEKKDLKNAEKRFERARKFKYDSTAISMELFDFYLKKKDMKSASKEIKELKKITGETETTIFLDGYIHYTNKNVQASLAAFEKLAEKMPEAKRNIGCIHYNQGEYQKAIEIWEDVLSQKPDYKDIQIDLGRAHFHAGDTEKAQEYFDKAGIKISPARYSPKKIGLDYEVLFEEIKFDLQCK
ncbi:MAG: tetratricopeptide repeat protein [Candidatus Aminicenantaceae bacterium]